MESPEDEYPPDPHLLDAALAGRLWATELTIPDRVFVVDQLGSRGESVGQIADRLHCSRRLVQRIRSTSKGDKDNG